MARYFLEFSMKSRILLLIGALAVSAALSGCAVAGRMAETAGGILNRISGDRGNAASQTVGAVGDLYTKVGQSVSNDGANGVSAPSASVEVVSAAAPAAAPAPVAKTATAPTSAKAKAKPAAKKPTTSSVQPVAATSVDQKAAQAKAKKGPVN